MPEELLESILNTIISEKRKDGWVSEELLKWTADQLINGVLQGGEAGNDQPEVRALTPAQKRQIQVFSGFKSYHQLKVATDLLYDKDGQVRPYAAFKRDVLAIDQEYNVRYLRAEYDLARANIRSANTWNDLQAHKDANTFIRYGTAEDERVRLVHDLLNGVIKHIDDPFWDVWWPPNGWGCRCNVRPTSSDAGSTQVPPDLVPPKTMFATNVGKLGVVFPQNHPYYKAPDAIAKEVHAAADAAPLWRTVKDAAGHVDKDIAKVVEIGLNAVHSVHLTPGLPIFRTLSKLVGARGRYVPLPKEHLFQILVNPRASWPELTFLHELAHHMDFTILDGEGYSSLKGRDLKNILLAVKQSAAYKQLSRSVARKEWPVGDRLRRLSGEDLLYARRLIQPYELFARAYAQYIAQVSGDKTLLEQLDKARSLDEGHDRFRQWETEDFKPIAKAFDALLKRKKWTLPK